MEQLSVFLTLTAFTSLITLAVGLVSPSTVSKWTRHTLNRKQIGLIFGGGFFLLIFISGSIAPEISTIKSRPKQEETKSTVDNQIPDTVATTTSIIVKEGATTTTNTVKETAVTKPASQPTLNTVTKDSPPAAKEEIKNNLYLVVRIIDGDTLELESGEKIRYIGVDTPESVSTKQPMECFGKEASAKNSQLVLNKKVRLEKDISETDRYGRLLKYVYLEDDTFVNDYLIRQGYAFAYTYPPDVKYSQQFASAQKEARENSRGLWSPTTCNGQSEFPISNTTTTASSTEQTQQPQTGHIWYTSSHYKATYYYCDTDEGWKGLSPTYLKSFNSAEELLKKYPSRILHKPC